MKHLLVVVALAGCKDKAKATESAPPATRPASKPVDTPAAKAAPALAAGESFVNLGVTETSAPNPVTWSPAGQPIQVSVVAKDGKAVARAYVGDKTIDVTESFDVGDNIFELAVAKGGAALHFRWRELVGRVEGAGAIFAFEDRWITWDAAAGKPIVSEKWSCDESTAKQGCEGPAWTLDFGEMP